MPSRVFLALIAAGLCGGAFAQEAPATTVSPVQIDKPAPDNPRWLRIPSAALIAKAYPDKALRRGIAGRVVLDCIVDAEGRMKDCQVVSETPAGHSFGQAGLKVSTAFLLTTTTPSGKSTEGTHMRIPLSFTASRSD